MNKLLIVDEYLKRKNRDWKKEIEDEFDIKADEQNSYICFKYGFAPDFKKELCRQTRGVIIEKETGRVVCKSFDKFFNDFNEEANQFDWSNISNITEKMDGSMIRLWWSDIESRWVWSTSGVVYADKAKANATYTFQDIINMALEDTKLDVTDLNKGLTYVFELVSPYNKIVIDYQKPKLYLLTVFDCATVTELESSLIEKWRTYFKEKNIDSPTKFDFKSEEEIKEFLDGRTDMEGVVVIDTHGTRVKIKTKYYLLQHRLIDHKATVKDIVKMIKQGYLKLSIIYNKHDASRILDNYYQKIDNITKYIQEHDATMSGKSRKEIALEIKDDWQKTFYFKHLDCPEMPVESLVSEYWNTTKLSKQIAEELKIVENNEDFT